MDKPLTHVRSEISKLRDPAAFSHYTKLNCFPRTADTRRVGLIPGVGSGQGTKTQGRTPEKENEEKEGRAFVRVSAAKSRPTARGLDQKIPPETDESAGVGVGFGLEQRRRQPRKIRLLRFHRGKRRRFGGRSLLAADVGQHRQRRQEGRPRRRQGQNGRRGK